MTRRGIVATLIAVFVASRATASERLPDDQSRREAIRLYSTGQEFFSGERFDRAAEAFAKATAKNPLFTLAYYQLGQSYMNLQRYAAAAQAFEQCIEASRALHNLVETNRFDVEKQRDDEIREMRETILTFRRGNQQARAMRAEEHLRDLERQRTSIGSVFQPPAVVLLSLGSARFRLGDRDAAEAEWRAALDVNPKLGEAHNNIAVIHMQIGRFDQALAELTLAEKAGFKVNPQFKADLKARAGNRR